MKIFSVRIFISLLTFLIGTDSPVFWFYYSYQPKVKMEDIEISSACGLLDYTEHRISESNKRFWNKEILGRFKEQPLEKTSRSIDESYRFTLLPTFDPPVSIRVWRAGNSYFLNVKKLDGQGGFGIRKFGRLADNQTRELTEDEWRQFNVLLLNSQFWFEPSLIGEESVNDGAEWIMEGVKSDSESKSDYHEVHRILPDQEFQESSFYLLKLAGAEKQYEGYYEGRYSS